MPNGIRRALTSTTTAALMGVLLSASTGCSLLSAAGNTKVLWAINEPAPMYIVVRRADIAAVTAKEVDRLLTATPVAADSTWFGQVGPDPKVAAGEMKAMSQDPMYKTSHTRVVAAEVWIRTLPQVVSASGDKPNLLAAIDPSLGEQYAAIMAKKQEIATLDATVETEKAAASADGVSADDKKTHQDAAAKAKTDESKAEDEVDPLAKKFLASVKDTASKVPADTQAKFAPAIANLLQAIDDADFANSAALVRYPLAFPKSPGKVLDEVKAAVPYIVADIIEEKTGVRPSFTKLDVQVTMASGSVTVVLNGIGPNEMAQLSIADVTSETIKRTGAWLAHATTLPAAVMSTKQELMFEHDVLAGLQAGFAPPAAGVVVLVKIPEANSPEVMAAIPAVHVSASAKAAAVVTTSATVPSSVDAKVGVKAGGKADPKAGAKAAGKADPKAAGKKPTDKK
jgi:hypothetical protein